MDTTETFDTNWWSDRKGWQLTEEKMDVDSIGEEKHSWASSH